MKDKFIVARGIYYQGHNFTRTESYGNVDLRGIKSLLSKEEELFKKSSELLKEVDQLGSLIVTVVEDKGPRGAFAQANMLFEEVLDIFATNNFGYIKLGLLKSGFIRSFDFSYQKPIEDSDYEVDKIDYESVGTIYHLKPEEYSPISEAQLIISLKDDIELAKLYIRSSYWSRQAKSELNYHFRLLYYWFAIESLTKVETEEDITPKIMLPIGFISKKYSNVSRSLSTQLQGHSDYTLLKKLVSQTIEKIRKIRNNTVHNGFRIYETDEIEFNKLNKFLKFVIPRIRYYIGQAVYENKRNLKEAWDMIPLLIRDDNNFVNHAHKNTFYFLREIFEIK
jgi:hypothetical protein